METIIITGSIATGKSTVSKYVKQLGYPLIDLDQVARKVVEPGTPGLAEIHEIFGDAVINPDGSLNRKQLGQIVFNDESKLQQLNQITHHRIYLDTLEQLEQYEEQGELLCFIDIPLFYEGNRHYPHQDVWLVYVPASIQLERLMERDHISREEAIKRIRQQLPIEWKKQQDNQVIDNSETISYTYAQVDQLLNDWHQSHLTV